jgi:hypothetical protein
MALRILLDENFPRVYHATLRRLDPELSVWIVGDPGAPPKGTPDAELLRWCEDQDALLVTNDRRTMPRHLAEHLASERHVPGILIFDPGRNVAEMAEDLVLLCRVSLEGEFADRITFLPLP